MERSTTGSNGGGGAVLNGAEFGNELGELVKRMTVWSSQVEDVLSDSTATAASIRASAQGSLAEENFSSFSKGIARGCLISWIVHRNRSLQSSPARARRNRRL